MFQMVVIKGLSERTTVQLLVNTFTGALKAWWDNLGDLKNVILNPPPNSSTPAIKTTVLRELNRKWECGHGLGT